MKYPFMDYVKDYMSRMKDVYAPITWKTVMRRFQRINMDVLNLRNDKKISTTSPKNMTVEDIRVYLSYRKSLDYTSTEYSHDQSVLKQFFKFVGNNAVEDCLVRFPLLKSKRRHSRLPSMSDDTYRRILEVANNLKPGDFRRLRAYTLVLLCTRTGLRTKEVKLAEVSDLDTVEWTLNIIHVKGEDSYGEPRTVPVHPEVRGILTEYLKERSKRLIAEKIRSKALFFSPTGDHLAENTLRNIKTIVERDIGESFDFRKLRRTFGQQLKDADVDIESISVSMGHATTKTTELNYARMRSEKANASIRGSW